MQHLTEGQWRERVLTEPYAVAYEVTKQLTIGSAADYEMEAAEAAARSMWLSVASALGSNTDEVIEEMDSMSHEFEIMFLDDDEDTLQIDLVYRDEEDGYVLLPFQLLVQEDPDDPSGFRYVVPWVVDRVVDDLTKETLLHPDDFTAECLATIGPEAMLRLLAAKHLEHWALTEEEDRMQGVALVGLYLQQEVAKGRDYDEVSSEMKDREGYITPHFHEDGSITVELD